MFKVISKRKYDELSDDYMHLHRTHIDLSEKITEKSKTIRDQIDLIERQRRAIRDLTGHLRLLKSRERDNQKTFEHYLDTIETLNQMLFETTERIKRLEVRENSIRLIMKGGEVNE